MEIDEIISQTDTLPPAPEVMPKLIELMKDPNADAGDIVELIATDAAIAAHLLKLSNSPAYCASSSVNSLQDAVSLIGIKEVYRIVSLYLTGDFLDGELPSMQIPKGSLWEHSLAVALVMDQICSEIAAPEGLPYTIGLLHDIGKLGLHIGCGERYVKVFKKVESERLPLNKAEEAAIGYDHAVIGARMLENWRFPEEVYLPIQYQFRPQEAPEECRPLTAALHVSNWAAAAIGCNDGRDSWALEMIDCGCGQSQVELAMLETRELLESARQSMKVEQS